MSDAPDDTTITLTQDEALVLFELLSRKDAGDRIAVQHHAERIALWSIQAQLEKVLVQPFRPDYDELLAAARARLVSDDRSGSRASQ